MYKYFSEKGIPATLCRGTTRTDTDFFYGEAAFWSSYCVGWVKEEIGKSPVCMYCRLSEPPEILYTKNKDFFIESEQEEEKVVKPKKKLIKKTKK
jgi:hypothetical protein